MDTPDLREARHDLRGRINALKLCVSALEIVDSHQERLEFLQYIEQAADKTCVALDRFEQVTGEAEGAAAAS